VFASHVLWCPWLACKPPWIRSRLSHKHGAGDQPALMSAASLTERVLRNASGCAGNRPRLPKKSRRSDSEICPRWENNAGSACRSGHFSREAPDLRGGVRETVGRDNVRAAGVLRPNAHSSVLCGLRFAGGAGYDLATVASCLSIRLKCHNARQCVCLRSTSLGTSQA
jgi:hypothetical protein